MSDAPHASTSGRRRPWAFIVAIAVIVLVAGGYAGLLAYMAANQNDLMFEPGASSGQPGASGVFATEVRFRSEGGSTLVGWYRAPPRGAPTILYLHGNAGALPRYADRIDAYLNAGFGVLAIDYQGFGDSTGEPSLDGVIEDARAARRFLRERGVADEALVLHGFSLGAMPATALAAEIDAAALVLEAPFHDIAAVAAERFWFLIPSLVAPLIDGGVDPIDAIANVSEPVFVMHGTADEITPIAFGRRLFEAAPNGATFLAVEGATHDGLLENGGYDAAIAFVRGANAD